MMRVRCRKVLVGCAMLYIMMAAYVRRQYTDIVVSESKRSMDANSSATGDEEDGLGGNETHGGTQMADDVKILLRAFTLSEVDVSDDNETHPRIGFNLTSSFSSAQDRINKILQQQMQKASSIKELIVESDDEPINMTYINANIVGTPESVAPEDSMKETISPHPHRIIYNRVGKCGSTTVLNIIKGLARRNEFNFESSLIYRQKALNDSSQKELADEIMNVTATWESPLLYERHFFYVDFAKYGHQPQYFINIIRDPLSRLVSSYYFRRLETRETAGKFVNRSSWNFNMTYDECVASGQVCSKPKYFFNIIPFFCGNEPECGLPSPVSLQKAKQHVAKYYPVIGVMEEMDKFFTILEYILPRYFNHALQAYLHKFGYMADKYKNKKRLPITDETRDIMMPLLWMEYHFLDWIKQRMNNQYRTAVFKMRYTYPELEEVITKWKEEESK